MINAFRLSIISAFLTSTLLAQAPLSTQPATVLPKATAKSAVKTQIPVVLPQKSYPFLANYYLEPDLSATDQANLAKYDLVILDKEVPLNYPKLFSTLRAQNPNIRIFVYVPVQHITVGVKKNNPNTQLTYQLNSGVSSKWYLKDSRGQHISVWEHTEIMDITSGWKDYLANFVATKILPSAKWDGVFFDGIEEKASWFGSDIDLNHDRVADDSDHVDWQWKNATVSFLKKSRQVFGNTLILANSPQEYYAPYLNGILFENFGNWPSYAWAEHFARYQAAAQNTLPPHVIIINGGTNDTGYQNDFAKMRYDLASTLLGNAYFSFDYGPTRHGQTWWYDEYSADLGAPIGPAALVAGNSENLRVDTFTDGMDRHFLYRESRAAPYTGRRVKGSQAIETHSIVGKSADHKWNEFLRSDPALLPLKQETGYRISFDYKILKPSKNGYFYFGSRSDSRPGLGDRQLASFNGSAGQKGRVSVLITTYSSDYYLYYGIKYDGSVAIDNIRLEEIPFGVWRRDFTNGVVLLNTLDKPSTLKLDQLYYHLAGNQQANVNNGTLAPELILPADDGIILLKSAPANYVTQ